MERIGISGTNGTRYPRFKSGCVRRRTSTPIETSTNAASVPMLVNFATTSIGMKPATTATNTPTIILDRYGVRKRGCTCEKSPGKRPSRAMEKKMRLCPYRSTISTVVNPQIAPTEMIDPATFKPTRIRACDTGEATFSFV